MTGFIEKSGLSFYSQPWLHPFNGELCPRGRGPQFIFSLQLGSCSHILKGSLTVGWSHSPRDLMIGWSRSLEKLVPARKNRILP